MVMAARQAIGAFRNDPLRLVLRITRNLTGLDAKFAVRAYPGAAGDPLLELGMAASFGAEGIYFVAAGIDGDGLPYSWLEIIADKASVQALPEPAEAGGDVTLAYDFQVSGVALIEDFSAVETTLLHGDFILKGSVND